MAQNMSKMEEKRSLLENKSFMARPAKIDEVGFLYELTRELAFYEGKDIEKLPLTKENLSSLWF